MGGGERQGRGLTYLRPKDSNTMIGVCNCATQKMPDMTDRQADKLSVHYSEIIIIISIN